MPDGREPLATILRAAVLLHNNGQSTSMTATAVQRLATGLGQPAVVIPGWASVTVYDPRSDGRDVLVAEARPAAVNMRRVSALMRAVDNAENRPLQRDEIERALDAAGQLPPSSNLAFVAACAAGAAALAVVFGAVDGWAIAVIAAAAALGGLLRRVLAGFGADPLLQTFVAALLAGVAGAVAGEVGLSASIGLIAVCPAMVLVPGPQILIGAMDLLAGRMSLALARLGYGLLVLAVIAVGLVLGLQVTGQALPLSTPPADVPLVFDVLAAGVAAACYPVFFAMPYRFVGWPIVVGMTAHAVHWWALTAWHASLPVAALLACLLTGAILTPVAYVKQIPFAAIGFAAVVALVPGMFVFRVVAGVTELAAHPSEQVLLDAVSNGAVAGLTVIAMAVGLAVPSRLRDWLLARRIRG
ncbi:threonine/serine exporter family protein [Mycobacterium sp. shizuoka-1]|uniref:threonine/serine exporter family protein n=1 Tax=Mycobacterium sp. shizuoka-1 TaxID=2039281 RepID=UPI00130464BA|nr:threonine/serine exporter family protein [Mycobacterium sp. shizuoka-1]